MKIQEKGVLTMGKRTSLISILIILSLIMSSCSSINQTEVYAIVTAMAIDIDGGELTITAQVINPSDNKDQEQSSQPASKFIFVQSRGKTILDAIRNASLKYDKRLFLSHNSLLIIGEDLAKRGIGDIINFFSYDIGTRETAHLVVAKGSKAYEIFEVSQTREDFIQNMIRNSKYTAKNRSLTFTEYLKYYFDRKTPVLGVVEKVGELDLEKGQSSYKDSLSLIGGAPFFKDRLIGYYNGDEMIGFNFLVDEIEDALMVFETPDYLTEKSDFYSKEGKYTSVEVVDSKTKLNFNLIDEKIYLTIDIYAEVTLAEETRGLNVVEIGVKEGVEKACSKQIEEYIDMVMKKAQGEFRMDTFGIGDAFHRQYPEIWKKTSDDWNEYFSDLEYSVNVNTKIVRSGLIDLPLNIRRGIK